MWFCIPATAHFILLMFDSLPLDVIDKQNLYNFLIYELVADCQTQAHPTSPAWDTG